MSYLYTITEKNPIIYYYFNILFILNFTQNISPQLLFQI
jgi:hypothetical protein